MGNLCWSIFEPLETHSPKANLASICEALPFDAEVSGRNDITIGGKKVSGSAFKYAKNYSLHHGTLLVDVNIGKMVSYLNVNKEKLLVCISLFD